MKIRYWVLASTFGRCSEGDIINEKRWAKLALNSCNAELTTLSMSGATFSTENFASDSISRDIWKIQNKSLIYVLLKVGM